MKSEGLTSFPSDDSIEEFVSIFEYFWTKYESKIKISQLITDCIQLQLKKLLKGQET